MDFSGKAVLITGASRGIGRACARRFAEHGARVAVHYHQNQAAAEATLAELPGQGHVLVQGDISRPEDVQRFVAAAAAGLAGLDVLVNNAGIYEDHPVIGSSYADWQAAWQRVLHANLVGAANAIFCAVPHFQARGGGRVVNVSSRGAFRGEPTAPAYGASKAGLNSLGQSLAKALAPHNIFIGTVAPGFVETDMATEFLAGPAGDFIRHESPLGRVATPADVATVVLFLAAPGSEFTTGTIIDCNGASYLRT